jgi:hypothetical protein
MSTKTIIQSQYYAALAMLRQAVEKCPDPLWADTRFANPSWHIAYHVLFYTHLYLQAKAEDFTPWEKHHDDLGSLENSDPALAYSKAEILDYLAICLAQVDEQVSAVDLAADSGFYWLPFSKLELQFYNIRHIQQHTGELCERLGALGEISVGWVGMKS